MTLNENTGELVLSGSSQQAPMKDTASTAAATQARALVESMYLVAINRPRDLAVVRDKLLRDCERKRFAEDAFYSVKIGGKPRQGPSVRFAESAMRALGNIYIKTRVSYEDETRRIVDVMAIDLESNTPIDSSFVLQKTKERKTKYEGDIVLSERTNQKGEMLYTIAASDMEVLQKQESVVSRIRRNLILQFLPSDIKDEALDACRATLRREQGDPKVAVKELVDGYARIGIPVAQLAKFLGHKVDEITPDELYDLRGAWVAVNGGHAEWQEILQDRLDEKRPSKDEKEMLKANLAALAKFRIEDAEIYEAALNDAGVAIDINPNTLKIDVIKRILESAGRGLK